MAAVAWDRGKYNAAADRQAAQRHRERMLRTGTPIPARITMALDLRELYGPEVDRQCDAEEPDVDRWETPDDPLLPTGEQVLLLAKLTDLPPEFFYTPIPASLADGTIWMCGPRGCETVSGTPVPPVLEAPAVIQAELFTAPRPVARARRPRDPAPAPAAAAKPATSGRMPDHLRAELLAKLGRPRRDP